MKGVNPKVNAPASVQLDFFDDPFSVLLPRTSNLGFLECHDAKTQYSVFYKLPSSFLEALNDLYQKDAPTLGAKPLASHDLLLRAYLHSEYSRRLTQK